MGILTYTQSDNILRSAIERYKEYRADYGSPRTNTEIIEMIEFITKPILGALVDWEVYEKTAQYKLEQIQELMNAEDYTNA